MFFTARQKKRYVETLLANATGALPSPTRRQQKKQEKAAQQEDLEAERIAASLPPPAPSFRVIDDGPSKSSGSDTAGAAHSDNGAVAWTRSAIYLGDLVAQNSKRWRDTGSGSSASLVGAQIYDPARVLARLNRSRASSAASLRSVPSARDSIRRVSEMTALTELSGPSQIGGLAAGRRSASPSPFGGGRASPYSNRSSSVPPARQTESALSMHHSTPGNVAGPAPRRTTPTRETLQRYSAERQSLQSLRSRATPVPYPVPE